MLLRCLLLQWTKRSRQTSPSSMLQMSPSSKLLAMMPLRVRRTPSLLLSRPDYWWHGANWGWYNSSWDEVSWHASGGYGQGNWAQDDSQPAPVSEDASGADPSGPEPKTEASASDDTTSTGRPGILTVVLLFVMLLRRLQMTASGACQKCPLLQMMTLLPPERVLALLKSRFWWKPR